MLLPIVRRLLGRPPLTVSKDDALAIAEQAYGKPLPAPLKVREQLTTIRVSTRLDTRPNGPWFIIDGYSGQILSRGELPR